MHKANMSLGFLFLNQIYYKWLNVIIINNIINKYILSTICKHLQGYDYYDQNALWFSKRRKMKKCSNLCMTEFFCKLYLLMLYL